MDLGAIGQGPSGTSLSRIIATLQPAVTTGSRASDSVEIADDSVITLLSELSAGDLAKLIDIINRPLSAQDIARLQDLEHTVVSAAAEGDATRAVGALSEMLKLDPSRPEAPRADPAIEPIRARLDQFLDSHVKLARLDAEGRLEQAAQQLGPPGPQRLDGWDIRPRTLVEIASRLVDAGGLANYARAAEMAQIVIDGSRWAPAVIDLPPATPKLAPAKSTAGAGPARPSARRTPDSVRALLKSLWIRAPLLILLLSWLMLGVAGGLGSLVWRRFWLSTWPGPLVEIGFQVWGIGFLALILFGFYARVRKARF